VTEWPIVRDCKSRGFMPTQVRILPGAHRNKEPNTKVFGDFISVAVGRIRKTEAVHKRAKRGLSPSRVPRYLASLRA
jgi:hypothetical protein